MKFSSVVSLHTNPFTCGVAKFGAELARRLDIPFIGINGPWGHHPLFSLKWSEPSQMQQMLLIREITVHGHCSVFWHDAGCPSITRAAKHVFYADPSLGAPGFWCPSLMQESAIPRAAINLFAMGMAHKIPVEPYQHLAELIHRTPHTFQLRMSIGIHEGSDLSEAVVKCETLAQAIGPENLSVLGCLSDAAVASEFARCQAVCAFFATGARANNTTVHAAMAAGKPVFTNLDGQSPAEWRHGVTVFDVRQLTAWPSSADLRRVGEQGRVVNQARSWEALLEAMRKECDN